MGLPSTIDPEADLGLPFTNFSDVADPQTDLDATLYETACVAVAGLTHTAARAVVVVSGAAGAGTAATTGVLLRTHFAVWGDTDAVKPTVTRTATGSYTVAWAASYADLNPTSSRAVTAATGLRTCQVAIHAAGRAWGTLSGNTVTVTTQGVGGTAANKIFSVFAY